MVQEALTNVIQPRSCTRVEIAVRERAVIGGTTTTDAPWYVIPADHKWYRDWAVLTVLVETLRKMDPHYPQPAEDLSDIVVA